jgi:hypothetical protein
MNRRDFDYVKPFRILVFGHGRQNVKDISYSELLNTREWFVKRIQILNRDNFFCKNCGAGETEYESEREFLIPNENSKTEIKIIEGYEVTNYAIAGISEHPIELHVHHKYYIKDKLPWDYPDDALITLCAKCHFEFHENNNVNYFDKNGSQIKLTPCHRCHGAGHFPEYNHVQWGICFRCNGNKFEELIKVSSS